MKIEKYKHKKENKCLKTKVNVFDRFARNWSNEMRFKDRKAKQKPTQIHKMKKIYQRFHFWFFSWIAYQHFGLFCAKVILLDEQCWYYLTLSCGNKVVHGFLLCVYPKLSITAKLEFELIYSNIVIRRVSNYPFPRLI